MIKAHPSEKKHVNAAVIREDCLLKLQCKLCQNKSLLAKVEPVLLHFFHEEVHHRCKKNSFALYDFSFRLSDSRHSYNYDKIVLQWQCFCRYDTKLN